jgi:hypothetical protein
MPANYVLLERTELNATAATVTFANIPQTGYTDLKVVISGRTTEAANFTTLSLTFNGNTSANYSRKFIQGYNSGAASSGGSSETSLNLGYINGNSSTASTFGNMEVYIPNYTSANNKSVSIDAVQERNDATQAVMWLNAGLWAQNTAINQITFTPAGGDLAANSTFSLYGLAALGTTPAIAPKASGGNIIDYDGTYWIHTFLSSGTFTPQTGLSCDYLVVAGGGGSGGSYAGGGAGGGLRSTVTATGGGGSLESALAVVSGTAYTVTVGAGGTGGALNSVGSNGSNSVFSTITSTGGGGGGGFSSTVAQHTGANGGSGGGGGNAGSGVTAPGGTGTTNQGFAGGSGSFLGGGALRCAGGGGGAGAVGANGVGAGGVGGNGGNGVASSISGSSVTRGGGGGGAGEGSQGSGGTGGGGTNSTGTVNTGGGGSMNYTNATGNAGGSGIVIIRYLA